MVSLARVVINTIATQRGTNLKLEKMAPNFIATQHWLRHITVPHFHVDARAALERVLERIRAVIVVPCHWRRRLALEPPDDEQHRRRREQHTLGVFEPVPLAQPIRDGVSTGPDAR